MIVFEFFDEECRVTEGPGARAELKLTRQSHVLLANPVQFSVKPLNISSALELSLITPGQINPLNQASKNIPLNLSLTLSHYLSSLSLSLPPLPSLSSLSGNNDFNNTVLDVVFPADEHTSMPTEYVLISIPVVDDKINEAEQQFVVPFEIADAVSTALIDISHRNISTCSITDNDCE